MIAAGAVPDGKDRAPHDARIVIENSKIVAIDPEAWPVDDDPRSLWVLPGWIDAPAHITRGSGEDGRNAGAEGTTREGACQAASNA